MDKKHNVGDRVSRRTDVYDENSKLMYGTVVECYSQHGGLDGVTWYDPEVYAVRWDHKKVIDRGYFRHGLTKVL